MLHPEAARLIRMAAANPAPKLGDVSPAQAREIARASIQLMDAKADVGCRNEDLFIPTDGTGLRARSYVPSSVCRNEVLMFFHGGGWVVGDLESHDSLCRRIAHALQLRVIAVDYRLAPEHPFPAAYDDANAAAEWLCSAPAAIGKAPTGILLAGDSAGGNLAAAVAANWSNHQLPLRGQLLLYPVVDVSMRSKSYRQFATGFLMEARDMANFIAAYAPEHSSHQDGRLSPLHGSLASVPPTVIVTAGCDVLRDEGRAYAARLVEEGIATIFLEASGYPHGWATMFGALPSSELLLKQALSSAITLFGLEA
jgi:acetyl esterase